MREYSSVSDVGYGALQFMQTLDPIPTPVGTAVQSWHSPNSLAEHMNSAQLLQYAHCLQLIEVPGA